MINPNNQFVETALSQYVETALWSSLVWHEDQEPTPMDDSYDASDIASETLAQMRETVSDFVAANADTIAAAGLNAEAVGHDLWLTQNSHGAGFWDRGLGVFGDTLTEAAKAEGSVDLYPGDDGKLYI